MSDLEQTKHAPSALGLNDLIAARWSPRSFSDKPVSSEDLTKIFTAAAWSASSSNEQPWRFLVGRKGTDTYAKIFDSLVVFNQKWATTAPVLILSVGKTHRTRDNQPNPYGLHDTGAASATLCLQAIALGIHTHGMGGFDRIKARTHFEIPDDFEIGAVWALGYLGDPAALPDDFQAMETEARSRKPLSEFVFNTWGEAASL